MATIWKYFTPLALLAFSLLVFFGSPDARVLFWHMGSTGRMAVAVGALALSAFFAYSIYRVGRGASGGGTGKHGR